MCDTAITIRLAGPADTAAIRDCVMRAYQHYVARIGREPGPMLDDYGQRVSAQQAYVATVQEKLAGILVLEHAAEGFLLDNVAVLPQARGLGVGRALMMFAEQQARAAGFASIYLYTHAMMVENRALYRRVGYEEYDRRMEDGLDRVYMRKAL